MSSNIGLIVGVTSGRVYAVVNPDMDHELDNPRHLQMKNEDNEPVRMVRVSRGDYPSALTFDDVHRLAENYRHLLE